MNITGEQVQMETARLNSDDRINNLTELYSRDKQVINEFLDNNHDLPSAVIEALALRLITLNDFIKMLDDTAVKKCTDVDNWETDPDVEVSSGQ